MTTFEQLPLAGLFFQLKKHGLELGVDDYELFLRAIQGGYCGESLQDLKKLCSTLWIKTESDARVFDHLFFEWIKPSLPTVMDNPTSALNAESKNNLNITDQDKLIETSDNSNEEGISSDQVDRGRAVSKIGFVDENWTNPNFSFSNNYFPVTRRQMKQAWRHLRSMVRVGPPIDLDVQLTIEKAARQGVLHDLILLPRRVNQAKLTLFIDQDGSMTPFKPLIRQLTATSISGKSPLARVEFYYFHDYPEEYLYTDAARLQARSLFELFNGFDVSTRVLIISDAGAARGSYDEYRIARTEKFIEMLNAHTKNIVWLNPMPRDRWKGHSAEKISEKIHMFEMSRRGLETAIKILRGQ